MSLLVLGLILLGTLLYLAILMIMRSGGMPRILFVIASIALGYLIYETVTKLRRL